MEVITLNNSAFVEKCVQLKAKLDVQPDMVLGILTGGGYVASAFNYSEFELVKLQ